MDGLARMEHICSVLQRGRAAVNDEAELEILETSSEVDTQYVAFRFEEFIYGEAYLDVAPLRRLYNGRACFLIFDVAMELTGFLQIDKLFNPLTLLVGPCLVSYLMYKSTIPVDRGGYHLPWWYVLFPSLPSLAEIVTLVS